MECLDGFTSALKFTMHLSKPIKFEFKQTDKKTVFVLGTMGAGKSTTLNKIVYIQKWLDDNNAELHKD